MLAAKGYPEKPRKGDEITGVAEAEKTDGVRVYHAGTRMEKGRLVTAGGRVLGVTGAGASLDEARAAAYQACEKVRFEGKTLRRDIAAGAAKMAAR